jgi:hypothetical protein
VSIDGWLDEALFLNESVLDDNSLIDAAFGAVDVVLLRRRKIDEIVPEKKFSP